MTVIPHLPPQPSAGAVNGIDSGAATLNGSVNPEGRHTTYSFEYGTTTSYGSSTPVGDAGSGLGAEAVTARLGGLTPSTTYHYRLVAQNAVGHSATPDAVFTTAAASPPSSSSSSAQVILGPEPPRCSVPHLIGQTLGRARRTLSANHCTVGKVTRPKANHGRKLGALVVVSSAPGPGAQPADGKVSLTLGHRHKPKHHHRR